jgi:hypothetical protein
MPVTIGLASHSADGAQAGEITVILPDGTRRRKTNDAGETEVLTETGRFGAWARFWEAGSGEHDGKHYSQVRHYAMVVFDTAASNTATTGASGIVATRFDCDAGDGFELWRRRGRRRAPTSMAATSFLRTTTPPLLYLVSAAAANLRRTVSGGNSRKARTCSA